MFKRKRVFFPLLSLILLSASLPFFIKRERGFSPAKVLSQFPYKQKWDIPLNADQKKLLDTISKQKFRYLGSGNKMYVFESEDKKYVVKFFKQNQIQEYNFFERLFHIFIKGEFCKPKSMYKESRKRLFESCKIAYQELQEESGMLLVHLTKTTHLKQRIRIIDQHGNNHAFEMDQIEFILQRRFSPIIHTIEQWIAENNEEKVKEAIVKILNFIKQRCEKRILDTDADCKKNLGFFKDQIVMIDTSELSYASEKYPILIWLESIKATYDLYLWLRDHAPQLADFLRDQWETLKVLYAKPI